MQDDDTDARPPRQRVLIIGGSGFVGTSLAHTLKDEGHVVEVFDQKLPPHSLLESIRKFTFGDVCDLDALVEVMDAFSPDVVIHLASWGMSGPEMLSTNCTRINVGGVDCVLEAMRQTETECLIYTSTYNVCYGGQEIDGGDESCPYFDVSAHTDVYSASKAQAEQLVLAANGRDNLRTCSLRPAAIYGDGEERHIPRIVAHIDSGLFSLFRIGKRSIVDWVHVENLCQAFVCAVDKLTDTFDPKAAPCGNAYFISDGTPCDQWQFLKPLVLARGRAPPSLVVPVELALAAAWAFEATYHAVGVRPMLTRAEVLKVGRTHNFSIAKARRELGYDPSITSSEGADFMAMGYSRPGSSLNYFQSPPLALWVIVNSLMALLYTVAFTDLSLWTGPLGAALGAVRQLGLWLCMCVPSSLDPTLPRLFHLAVAIHLFEALLVAPAYCLHLGVRFDLSMLWVLQTLSLGGGSLQYLVARSRQQASK